MDDQLLQELYGVGGEEYYSQDDDLIKEAQAELIEAVADEAGIDLNEMDDDELEKFASYVLSPDEAYADEAYADEAYADEAYADEAYAEADQMGRVMAHAYADEQMKIASAMELDHIYEASLEKVAHNWDMMKIAAEADKTALKDRTLGSIGEDIKGLGAKAVAGAGRMSGYRDIKRGLELRGEAKRYLQSLTPAQREALDLKAVSREFKGLSGKLQRENLIAAIKGEARPLTGYHGAYTKHKAGQKLLMRGAGKAALTTAALGAAGYGANKLIQRRRRR